MTTAGIILCGGTSTRMGHPKAGLRMGQETFLARAARILSPCVSRLIVAAAPGQILPQLDVKLDRIDDAHPGQGPLPALGGALAVARRQGAHRALVLAVDMPLVTTDLLDLLLNALAPAAPAAIPIAEGRPQPLCGAYLTSLDKIIDEQFASGVRSLHEFLDCVPHRLLAPAHFVHLDPAGLCFRNINTPEEYEEALRLIAQQGLK